MSYAVLAELPEDHLLRNRPLASLGAEYRNAHKVDSLWIVVRESMGIGKCTFNDLRGTWIENNEWRVCG